MKPQTQKYDFVIIGSGFGGAVSALRLSEKNYSVLVIEKGKHYKPEDFPKNNWQLRKWLWLPGLKMFGIQKLTFLKHISIMSGVGVGGGSLVYANTLPKPKMPFFKQGSWKDLDDWAEKLSPYYELAWQMLGASVNPYLGPADLALKKIAEQTGKDFKPAKVGVYFGKPGQTVDDPYFEGKGPARTGCTFCGACMTGCRDNAKNSLDKNYLYLARQNGAEILAEHKVIDLIPLDNTGENGYEVIFKRSTTYFGQKKSVKANAVIFAGGVLGTVPLLLKLKKKRLPKLSAQLGKMVRTNNESLIFSTVYKGDFVNKMSEGIAIGSIMTYDKNSHIEPVRYGKGSGVWGTLLVPLIEDKNFWKRNLKLFFKLLISLPVKLKILLTQDFASSSTVLLFMQHLDSTIHLKTSFFGLSSRLDKEKNTPTAFIPEALNFARSFSKTIGAIPQVLFTESVSGIPSTAHILGGACMGRTAKEGVIDKNHKVFGYQNLYVFDGSSISANPGVNPSLTITALTEYGMQKIPIKKEN